MKGRTNGLVASSESANGVFKINVSGLDSGFEISVIDVSPIEGYEKVAYVETKGSQYIDTGFIPNQNTRVVMTLENTDGATYDNFFFGVRKSSSSTMFTFLYSGSSRAYRTGYNNTNRLLGPGYTKTGVFEVDKNKNVTYIDGQQTYSETVASFTCESSMIIGGVKTGANVNYGYIRIYSCRIYDNGVLVRDYLPAKNSSGVYGLYDRVNGSFHPSATSTAFIGGADDGTLFLHNTIAVQTAKSGNHKLDTGKIYMIQASKVNGYLTPSSKTFLPFAGDVITVEMKYHGAGVYIQDVNGDFWELDEWNDETSVPSCVVLNTTSHRFGIAINNVTYDGIMMYESSEDKVEINLTELSESRAILDYNGPSNTVALMDAFGSDSTYAAGACANFIFPNGRSGYMGAAGELYLLAQNKDLIDKALTILGGTVFKKDGSVWSSTLESEGSVTRLCYIWIYSFQFDKLSERPVYKTLYARPFCTIE